LHDATSKISPSSAFLYKLANSSPGATKVTAVTGSVAGPVSGQYWPSSTAGHFLTKTNGGTKVVWITAPLSASVTLSGSITPNLWGLESAAQCNCGLRYQVLRWSAAGGIDASLGVTADSSLSEWGTSAAVRTAPSLAPPSTAFAAGDRIVIVIYNDDASGVTQASGRNWTLDYDGPTTGSDGDTYLSFAETLSFAADTNNAPPLPVTTEGSSPARGAAAMAQVLARPFRSLESLEVFSFGGIHAQR